MPGNSSASDTGPLIMANGDNHGVNNPGSDLHQHDEPAQY